jgi:mRNA deadenylase 3'-5' endonuclease subunit Ccr4
MQNSETALRVLSYNILAPSYARPDRYPFTEGALLAWEARRERLAARLRAADADLLCLQEVEPYVFRFLQSRLEPYGYEGLFAQKAHNRPDGSATFYRADRLALRDSRTHYYRDGAGEDDSGHLALISRFGTPLGSVALTNTHIRWDDPLARGEEHVGFRQVRELVERCAAADTDACIVCGDFNAEPDTDLIRTMVAHGFTDAYALAPQPTANSERRAKRIDYLFHSASLASAADSLPPIDDETPLPSETEPSDHLPISATLTLVGGE